MSDGTYAPKSPDLSSFYSADPIPTPQTQTQTHPAESHHYTPRLQTEHSVVSYDYGGSYTAGPAALSSTSASLQRPHPGHPLSAVDVKSEYQSFSPQQYLPPQPGVQPPTSSYGLQSPTFQQGPYAQQAYLDQHQHPPSSFYQPPQSSAPYPQPIFPLPGSADMPPRKAAQAAPPPPAIEPSPVRTKFPTARIKRIMQADEEVGKVAQQTPIAVGKALELFMIALVTKSAEVAKDKNSKRVTAQMLKQVVETDDQWDFLREIVGRVENEEKKGSRVKAETDSDEEPETKKKGKGGRKKKT